VEILELPGRSAIGGTAGYRSAVTDEKAPDRSALVLRLGVTGELGQMDYPAVLNALQGGYDLLQRTAHRVLGDRADALRWQLTGVLEGSVMTLVRTTETDEVTGRELYEIAETYTPEISPSRRIGCLRRTCRSFASCSSNCTKPAPGICSPRSRGPSHRTVAHCSCQTRFCPP